MKIKNRKIENPRLLLLSFLIMYTISGYQFYTNYSNYQKLKSEGIITKVKATFIPKKFGPDYYHLEFKTVDGRTVSKTAKCGGKDDFDNFYADLKVVYHLDDPNNYLELPYFENYMIGYKIFFFFGLYGLMGVFIIYQFLRFGIFMKNKKNREKMTNTLHNIAQQSGRLK